MPTDNRLPTAVNFRKKGCLVGRAYGLIVCCLFPVAVAVVPAPRTAPAAEPVTMKIGLPESMFSGLPQSVVQRASKPFQTMLEKQAGLKGEIAVGRDCADLTDQLRTEKLDIAVLHGFEYAWVKHHPELVPLVLAVPMHKIQACLVVNANSKVKTAADLKGDSVAVPGNTKAHCHLFFDRLKATLPEGSCGVAKLKGKSIEEALDAVSDEACPAVLVDAGTLVAYQKLKPGAGDQLKVLAQSDPFPPAVIVSRKGALDAAAAKRVRDGLVKCVDTVEGQLLTSLWRLKGFEEATPQYQADLDKCLKAYPAPKQK
jgi:ABC-type phosphate/phosphonate transport system substrate-binding protein